MIELFILTVLSSVLGNLRNIFLIKDEGYKKYLITALDTIIFALIVQSISKSTTLEYISVFTAGKIVGLLVTDLIIKKTDNSVYLVNLYVDKVHLEELSNYFLEQNMSFTLFQGKFNETIRYQFSLHLIKSQLDDLKIKLTEELGIAEPTLDLTTVKIQGKIKTRI